MLPTRRLVLVCLASGLLLGCERPEERGPAIPAGVSVDPPRRAAETGSVTLPGQQPDARLEGGAEGATLDTVSPPVQTQGQGTVPAQQPPAGAGAPAAPPPGR